MTEHDKHAVRAFLRNFKRLIREGNFFVLNREANNEALIHLGINQAERRRMLLDLSVTDYSSGPDPDVAGDGYVWTFGKTIEDIEVYIKIKTVRPPSEIAKCISFHKAQTPLHYPFRSQ